MREEPEPITLMRYIMSSLLSFDVITNDLKTLESNLKNEVKAKFANVVWDEKPYETEMNWNWYYKVYGAGQTVTARSTRKCLDDYRSYKRSLGESTKYIVGLR